MSKSGQEEEGKFETKFEHDIILGSKRKKETVQRNTYLEVFLHKRHFGSKINFFSNKEKIYFICPLNFCTFSANVYLLYI